MSTAEDWATVEALFQETLLLPEAQRALHLRRAAPDASLRAEVEALLAAHERRGVLDLLVEEVMAPLLPSPALLADPTVSLPAHSRYRLLEQLGKGGMGVVYRASDDRLGREVALKFLPTHLSSDPTAKKRFLVEARAAAAIEHPNICTVHEIGEASDGTLHIVMACYDGETLDRCIARGPLPVSEAIRVGAEITRGLIKAHQRGIVHRDIKPANVMITADGLVKILDFGIAKLSDVTATQATGAIGTLAYMSPEQAFGESVDHRTDLWSLGVVMYEMIAGVRPFRGRADQALLAATLSADPAPFSQVRSDVPAEVEAIVHTLLAKRPGDRYADAAQLLSALLACSVRPHSSERVESQPVERTAPDPTRDARITRSGERRHVTLVVCTIDGHDALFERLAPDDADGVLTQIRDAAAESAGAHGGVLNQSTGDGLVMLFGVPTAHDEDALSGVRAAMTLQARVRELATSLSSSFPVSLRLRIGVHVGPVVVQQSTQSDRQYRLSGAPVDVASRLNAAAEPDSIVISTETRRLVTPFIRTTSARDTLSASDGVPISTFAVIGESDVRSRLDGTALETLTPFVGRERERHELLARLDAARSGSGTFTAIVGEAGVGKSRLSRELREGAFAGDVRVLVGHCDAYARSTPFAPFIEIITDALAMPEGGTASERHEAVLLSARAIDRSLDEFLPLLLALLSIPSAAYPVPEQLRGDLLQSAMLDAIAALLTLGSHTQPTLLLLEDWHWADEASRAALRNLSEILANAPLMLVATSRPDASIDWGNADHLRVVHLTPLDDISTRAIACGVLGASSISPELAQQLHERTGGNPFFLEEVCEALREVGAVTVHDGSAAMAGEASALLVPETVQAVLRTRIDRLDAHALEVLRIASVIGRDFARGVLDAVYESRENLPQALERLKASGLVQQVGVVPEPLFRFKHALTQEVAYDSLLEHQRASMHLLVGRAIEARYAGRLETHVERLAHHFGRAEAWAEAVSYGLLSADRTMDLNQNADALSTLERVESWLVRLPEDTSRRDLEADVLFRQERLSETLGMRNRQLGLVERLIALLAPFGPSERLAQAYLRQGDAFTLLRRFE
jgi:class 3 adenylate cyclase